MNKQLQSLLENQVLNEETRQEIKEAWEKQISEAKKEIAVEVREEFASRYEKDKMDIVEAMDQKINDSLQEQVDRLQEERDQLLEERVQYKKNARKHAESFLKESTAVLKNEIKEFKEERQMYQEKMKDFHSFVQSGIENAVVECYQEQTNFANDRARFKAKSALKIEEAKKKTVRELALAADSFVTETLRDELSQLKEEIAEARQNDFGKKIFEAFMTEFSMSFYDGDREMRKLSSAIQEREQMLENAKKMLDQKDQQLVEANRKIKLKESQMERQKILKDLTGSLGSQTRELMEEMLENVPNNRLMESFNKYLPVLLEETGSLEQKKMLKESKKHLSDVTGDKKPLVESTQEIQKNTKNSTIDGILKGFHNINVNKN